MKATILKTAVGAALLCSVAPAFAHVVQPLGSPPVCPTASQCVAVGGDPMVSGAASNAAHTLRVAALKRDEPVPSTDVPEPGSLALMSIGALAVGYISRRYGGKRP